MEIPFLGGAYEGKSKSINAQQSINMFPVYDQNEAKVVRAMYGTPGTVEFSDPEYGNYEVRAMTVMGSELFIVVREKIYKVSTAGTVSYLSSGKDLSTTSGHVGIASNGTQVLIVDGSVTGRIVTTSTVTSIGAADDFPVAVDCAFFDGYFLVIEKDTGRFQISTLYNGLLWDALEYAHAESAPDDLVGIGVTKKNVWLLGYTSVEVYYDSGNADFPFERVPGAVNAVGCGAVGSIIEIKDRVYWFTDSGKVVRSSGYQFEPISTPTLDYQFSTYGTTSDAIGFMYTLEGRFFYALNFPTAGKTWVVDTDTGDWHEWKTGSTHFRGISSARFNGKMYIGSRTDGKIYELDPDTYTDAGALIKRVRRAQIINKERVNVIHSKIELEFEPGIGLNVDAEVAGYDPEADLTWSDDGVNTWATTQSKSMGKYEEYDTRCIWRSLGASRNRVYELTVEEPVKFILIGAYSNLQACKF